MSSRPPFQNRGAPDAPRRPSDYSQALARRSGSRPGQAPSVVAPEEEAQLIVPADVKIEGKITAATQLLIQGQVEADVEGCRNLEVAAGGYFKGRTEVEIADVSGTIEGNLTVTGQLIIRSHGRVVGHVRYHDLHIEAGGRLAGQVDSIDGGEVPPVIEEAPEMYDDSSEGGEAGLAERAEAVGPSGGNG